ncbi:hypothetical protein PaecuDRAFT_2652 [Paenibacillus curdlanolyticus YK9]|uniref:FG-GAP repeat protein n=1 Tax=Paenibacillus curdlanolyticus YK9 TaxID=717606 RepID=E0IAG3_9BACL|nr:VCBS repeat-containing protein [Paenibacillus curdlanolyticus]EFM10740.1 hypothetical protein PaecuDRAFT_2652 [Paenibacillus curdlanolyticus YK9]
MNVSRVRMPALAAVALLIAIVTSACSMRSAPADLLLPVHGADEELTKAVSQMLPDNASLTLVDREQKPQTIRQADLDGDGRAEAIVTYKDESEQSKVMLLRQDKTRGRWSKWATIEENSSFGIDWLKLVDLNFDGTPELLVGFNSYEPNQRTLYVYNGRQAGLQTGMTLKPAAELPYAIVDDGDLDDDGRKELVLVQQDNEKLEASLSVYRMEATGLKRNATIAADGGVNGYYDIRVGKIANDRKGIMLQASLGAHTEAVYMYAWEKRSAAHTGAGAGQLREVFPSDVISRDSELVETYFPMGGTSDSNSDGILDFAAERTAPGQPEDTPYSNLLTFQEYLQWDGKKDFSVVGRMYEDFAMGIRVHIPEQWGDHFTFALLTDPSSYEGIQFQMYEPSSGARARLFDLLAIPAAKWEEAKEGLEKGSEAYSKLLVASGMVYMAVYGTPPENWSQQAKDAYQAMLLNENQLSQRLQVMERP